MNDAAALPESNTSLAGFEAWDPDSGLPANEGYGPAAFVSVRRCGTFGLNRNARQLIGNPGYVELLFDPHRRRIGLRPVGADHPRGRKLIGGSRNGYASVGARKFCQYYGITLGETRRYTPKVVDGVLVVDL